MPSIWQFFMFKVYVCLHFPMMVLIKRPGDVERVQNKFTGNLI